MSPDLVKQIKESQFYPELERHIISAMDKINSFNNLEQTASNEQLGESVKAKMEAYVILSVILKPFLEDYERPKPTEEQIKAAQKRYGL